MGYFDEGSTLPSPFNLIISPKSIYYFILVSKILSALKQEQIRKLVKTDRLIVYLNVRKKNKLSYWSVHVCLSCTAELRNDESDQHPDLRTLLRRNHVSLDEQQGNSRYLSLN